MAKSIKAIGSMIKSLGQSVGVVTHHFDITLDSGVKATASIKIDFTNTSDIDIKSMLASNRIISGQRTWRRMSLDEFNTDVNAQTFAASSIGQKVKTHEEKVVLLRSTMSSLGYDDEQIELACNHVDRFIDGLTKEYPNAAHELKE